MVHCMLHLCTWHGSQSETAGKDLLFVPDLLDAVLAIHALPEVIWTSVSSIRLIVPDAAQHLHTWQ